MNYNDNFNENRISYQNYNNYKFSSRGKSLTNYDNDSIRKTSNQEIFLKYSKYLKDIIKNYDKGQRELHRRLNSNPDFKRFYRTISEWVYCTNEHTYYNIYNKECIDKLAFSREMFPSFSNFVDNLSLEMQKRYKKYLKFETFIGKLDLVRRISGFIFDAPNEDPLVFTPTGLYLNTYRAEFITKEKSKFTPEDEAAIRMVEFHIQELIGSSNILDDQNRPTSKLNYQFFMDWISFQVQHPGELLRFAPVLQGIHGTGKSYFVQLLRAIISPYYVKTVSNSDLQNSFNPYVTDRLVNVVEELYIDGKKEHYVLDKMKEFITSDEFVVNKKNVQQYSNPNKTNYLFVTNHKNCLPLADTERRYWIIFSPVSVADRDANYNTNYFNDLFDALNHKEALRSYFLNRKISKEFLNHNRAPRTLATKELQAITKSNTYGYDEAIALLSKETQYYNEKVIISCEFFKALARRGIKLSSNRAKTKLMQALNYVAYLKTINYEKHATSRIFIKNTLYDEEMETMDVKVLYQEFSDPKLDSNKTDDKL